MSHAFTPASLQAEIDPIALKFTRKLGAGAFGEVWRAELWSMDVAVKKLR